MNDNIYNLNEITDIENTKTSLCNITIDTRNEIVQIITGDDKEQMVLHRYYNNGFSIGKNVKIFPDIFVKNDIPNSQLQIKVFPYLYGSHSKEIVNAIEKCLNSSNEHYNTKLDPGIHLFYLPDNHKPIIDPKIDSAIRTETNEIIIKITMSCPGYFFIANVEEVD